MNNPVILDITFFLYLSALGCGLVTISFAALFYHLYKKTVILFFSGFFGGLLFIQVSLVIQFYQGLFSDESRQWLSYILSGTNLMGLLLVIYFLPRFTFRLVSLTWTKVLTIIWSLVSIFFLIFEIVHHIFNFGVIRNWLVFILFFGVIILSIALCISRFKIVGDLKIRKFLLIFGIVSSICVPLIMVENLRPFIAVFKLFWIFELFSLPLFFLLLTPLVFIMSFYFFNRPAYLINGHVSTHFITKYKITRREREVIECILSGMSYRETAGKLSISMKTADTHIQNIYQKTIVRNRLQLLNLIISNQ